MATEIIGIVELTESQAAKYATHNQALRELEGRLVRVKSRTTTAQPGSPANGDTYIVPTGATGTNWSGQDGKVAHYYGGSWKFWTPVEGARVWANDEDQVWAYTGSAWVLDTKMPMLSKSVAGGVDVTLTEIESRYPAIDLTGTITANINVVVTTTPKLFVIKNSTSGSFSVTVKTSAGTGVVVSQGARVLLYCDGTNVVDITTADLAAHEAAADPHTQYQKESELGTAAFQNIGTSGANVPLLNAANVWTARQSISEISPGIRLKETDQTDKNWFFVADGALFQIQEATDADTFIRGHSIFTHGGGFRVGSPTGGDKGAGTINAVAVYDDNVLLTCYVLEAERTGRVDSTRWDDRVLNRETQDGEVEVVTHEPARRFADRAAELLDPAQYAAAWKASGHLPSMPSPAEWEAAGKKMGLGEIVQRMWEALETQAVHIEKLRARIEALEAK